jgi:MFS family permease
MYHSPLFWSASSFNIFLWAVVLLCHAACKSFGALFAVRFLLGMCEGAITPGFMIVTSMFYTHAEQTRRVGYWCMFWFPLLIVLSHFFFQFWWTELPLSFWVSLAMASSTLIHPTSCPGNGRSIELCISYSILLIAKAHGHYWYYYIDHLRALLVCTSWCPCRLPTHAV